MKTQNQKPETEKIKRLVSKSGINSEIQYLRAFNIEYTYIISNYTMKLEYEGVTITDAKGSVTTTAFAAHNKILKDLNTFSANEIPSVRPDSATYFNIFNESNLNLENAYLVDISNCYASILFKDGFISQETFNYLLSLDKKSRLAAVGMLAAKKDVFKMKGNTLISHEEFKKDTQGLFFYCVNETNKIMCDLKNVAPSIFLCWVDCVYFTDISEMQAICERLDLSGLKYKKKKINNLIFGKFEVYENKRLIHYIEPNNKGDLKTKLFYLPDMAERESIKLIKYLMNKQEF